jgi:hypothetical protein
VFDAAGTLKFSGEGGAHLFCHAVRAIDQPYSLARGALKHRAQ